MPTIASRVTGPLQTLVVVCSAVFVVGTALQTFVVIDQQTLVEMMRAAGVVVIPPEVFEVTRARFGVVGLLPSWVTDGGAAVLSAVLIATLVRYRRPWAYRA